LYSTRQHQEDDFSDLLLILVENSILTRRQLSIIIRRLKKEEPPKNISTGAYYRQVKQCRKKIKEIIYTLILLRVLQVFDNTMNSALERITVQIAALSLLDQRTDNVTNMIISQHEDKTNLDGIFSVLENVIMRLVNI
jgi:hypothetical protein